MLKRPKFNCFLRKECHTQAYRNATLPNLNDLSTKICPLKPYSDTPIEDAQNEMGF